ncbi:MAG: LytTR family DNA-binding domain-containing protein [Bacteroidota bacterium]
MWLFQYFTRPYTLPIAGWRGLLVSLGIGFFIGFFLWFFEPFDLNNPNYSDGEIWLFGLISFVFFGAFHSLLPLLLPRIFTESNWTIGRQMLFYLLLLLAVATGNGLYINFLLDLPFSWGNYWFIIIRTIILGFIPISLYLLLVFNWKHQRMSIQANTLGTQLKEKELHQESLTWLVHTNLKNQSFSLHEADFLFARAEGNYVEIHREGQHPVLERLNLRELEQQLTGDKLLRCHRSFLVNLGKVQKVSGNAQGLKLWLADNRAPLPVSRRYIETIRQALA